jgi:methionine-rich copper-binding protein CopC
LQRVVALLIFSIAILIMPPAANAHVSVISTSPQYQSTIDALPERIVIGFNSPLIVLGAAKTNTVDVINPNGESITAADVKVDGSTISVALNQSKAVAGDYTVRYRVVSTDGHAVSGSYHFLLSTGQPAAPLPPTQIENEHGFWHVHSLHVIEGLLALLAIGGWAFYRSRFAPGK